MNQDIYAGSATGVFKSADLAGSSFTNINSVQSLSPKTDEIVDIQWNPNGGGEDEILIALIDKSLKLYDPETSSFSPLFQADKSPGKLTNVVFTKENSLISGVDSGNVDIWDIEGTHQSTVHTGDHLSRVRVSPIKPNVIAATGRESILKLWDLENPDKPTFAAKNVKPDFLQLRIPIYDKDIRFVPNSDLIVSCTAHHQIRMYDPRTSQRKPVCEAEWSDAPFTSLDVTNNPNLVVAGNSRGGMASFDIRSGEKGKMVGVFKGFAGSVRCVEAHPDYPYVASCSADRFIRLHNIDTRKMVRKIYCKTPLNSLVLRKQLSILNPDGTLDLTAGEEKKIKKEAGSESDPSDRSDSEDDLMWEGMETVKGAQSSAESKNKGKKRALAEECSETTVEADQKVKIEPEEEEKEDSCSPSTTKDNEEDSCQPPVKRKRGSKSKKKRSLTSTAAEATEEEPHVDSASKTKIPRTKSPKTTTTTTTKSTTSSKPSTNKNGKASSSPSDDNDPNSKKSPRKKRRKVVATGVN